MKTNYIYIILVVAVVVIGGWYLGSQNSEPSSLSEKSQTQKPLQKVPNFSLQDYSGSTHSLDLYADTPLVINSWASWCPFCFEELADFAKVQEEFGDTVWIFAINRAESRDTAKQFTDAYQVTDKLLLLLDPDDSFYKSIGGFSMPETIFVNRKGEIVEHVRGPMKQEVIREKISRLLKT